MRPHLRRRVRHVLQPMGPASLNSNSDWRFRWLDLQYVVHESGLPVVNAWPGDYKAIPISDLLHGAAARDPVLETAEVPHIGIAEILEGLAGESGTNAGAAIDQYRLALLERRIVGGQIRIGSQLQHAARDVN